MLRFVFRFFSSFRRKDKMEIERLNQLEEDKKLVRFRYNLKTKNFKVIILKIIDYWTFISHGWMYKRWNGCYTLINDYAGMNEKMFLTKREYNDHLNVGRV